MAKTTAKKLPPSPRPKKVDAKAPRTLVKAAKPVKVATPAPPPKAQKAPAKPVNDDVYTWHGLQEVLRDVETSAEAQEVLDHEVKGPARLRWMLRIQGRLSALRSAEEIAHLESVAKE